ncbi:MFS transporter [Pseudoroseomonas wenyumeiae]|uniref:MFS transporter n=1 Tax=Teichococcus wenyumeiae TaxID=2478470 RepID=A0A3A9JJ92_9PROT|nr:MFS transporter [Pseudoroseomonas wenyumeiae]RKK03816.1 MFS transporter [Pseudoroseomonas wenyumeiae]RMI24727.1 MFS transporter [Pseudoroseomonas wenyumeiae]
MPQIPVPNLSHAARYAALLGTVYAALGISQPFLPAFLAERGLQAGEVSVVLALGSAVRLLAGPFGGRLADRLGDPRLLLALSAAAAALACCGFLLGAGLLGLVLAQLVFSTFLAPLVPVSEAVTLSAARRGWLDYPRVRAAGSATFILASALGGWAAGQWGFGTAPMLMAAMLALTALAALLPRYGGGVGGLARAGGGGGFRAVLALPGFRRLLLLSALMQGSHAALYAFGAIHWAAAGHAPVTIGLLWAEGVVAEILLFAFGRRLTEALGIRGMMLLGAFGGLLRWGLLGATTWLPALVLAQLLHAATFGAQYLGAMRLLQRLVPPDQASTAQTLHASLGGGLGTGLLTLACGPLYAAWGGAGAFWAMAVLCLLAVPVALGLRRDMPAAKYS